MLIVVLHESIIAFSKICLEYSAEICLPWLLTASNILDF